jgi:hypothetical protein
MYSREFVVSIVSLLLLICFLVLGLCYYVKCKPGVDFMSVPCLILVIIELLLIGGEDRE